MMKQWMLSVCLLWLSVPVMAADLVDTISQKLAATPRLQARFVQTRQLAALKKPLVIQGRMVFERDHGVIWQIEKPYRMGYVMTAKGVLEMLPDGTQKERPAGNVPGIGSVEGLFRGILTADRVVLGQNFEAQVTGSANAWTITLVPKNASLQKALKEVMLEGDEQVKGVRIQEVNGDDTQIRFSQIESLQVLAKEDSQLLNGR